MEVCMSTAFHRESKITLNGGENWNGRTKNTQQQWQMHGEKKHIHTQTLTTANANKMRALAIIWLFEARIPVRGWSDVYGLNYWNGMHAVWLVLYAFLILHPVRSKYSIFHFDSMQIRPLLTAFQFAHNLTSCHFFTSRSHYWRKKCMCELSGAAVALE